jgi:acyl-CoA thioesterase FadM
MALALKPVARTGRLDPIRGAPRVSSAPSRGADAAHTYDRGWYAERSSHWLVRSVELRIHVSVVFGARLAVSTEVTGWRRVLAHRRSRFVDDDGEGTLHAEVETDWVLLGPTGRPASVPTEIVDRFAPGASFVPLRVTLPPIPVDAVAISGLVRDADVDPMGHLNNAAYLDLVDEALARAFTSSRDAPDRVYRLEYLRPALAGARLTTAAWQLGPNEIACVISAEGIDLCRAVVLSGHG